MKPDEETQDTQSPDGGVVQAEHTSKPASASSDSERENLTVDEAGSLGSKKTPKRKKKKKRRAKPTLDATGRLRPAFVLDFPKHPELDQLVSAFERGDYALVRDRAPELAEKADDPAVRDAALELRRRIDPDPLIKYFLLMAAALLALLTAFAYHHSH